jgi:hypothetical protein
MKKNMKKGDVVYSSGQGKTEKWSQVKGIITKVEKDKIYVKWDNTSFEDEMGYHDVLRFDTNQLLRFSDGVDIFTGGEYRIIEETDGYYVTGRGRLIPVKSRQEGEKIIHQMKEMLEIKKFNILPVNVSLDELIQLNNMSISNNYNRNLQEDFHLNFGKDSTFIIRPLLTHHHKQGLPCEPHIRYLVTQLFPQRELQSVLDLPNREIGKMLR